LESSFLSEAPRHLKSATNRPSDRENSTKQDEMEWWNDNERGKPKYSSEKPEHYHLDQNPTRTFSRSSMGLRVTGWLLHARASTGRTIKSI